MRYLAFLALLLCSCAAHEPVVYDVQYSNGMWFDGEGFRPANAYSENGRLVFSDSVRSARAAVDLQGGYVLPPFCEGHNHNLGMGTYGIEGTIANYVRDGVFYVIIPSGIPLYRDAISGMVNHPASVDAVFSNSGITGAGGHPIALRERLMDRHGAYSDFSKETLRNNAYFVADTEAELDEIWPLILAQDPAFIKIMLLNSEEYEARRSSEAYFGKRGLNPALLPMVVERAHAAGLRVFAHIETDEDMATALRAGIDGIAHVLSYNSGRPISDETLALVAERKPVIMTTASFAKKFEARNPEAFAQISQIQADNLRKLKDAGARIIIGSDNVYDTSLGEAQYLEMLDVFSNVELLNMWTAECASVAFPDRLIGKLEDGYEADFIVLEDNPVEDFGAVTTIRLRVRAGEVMEQPAAPQP